MDIALALEVLIPAANYTGSVTSNTQEAYASIVWSDERPKPSWEEIITESEILELAEAKKNKKSAIRMKAAERYLYGFVYNGQRFHAKQENVSEIAGMRQVAESSINWIPLEWPTVSDNYYLVQSKQDMLDFSVAFLAFRLGTHNVSAGHSKNVDALETIEAVTNYDFTQGWPE